MKRNRSIGSCMSQRETFHGFVYLAFQMLFLPGILEFVNTHLEQPLSSAELNFLFYLINFIAILMVFQDFLGKSLNQVWQHPIYFLEAVILGFVFYYICRDSIGWLVEQFFPGFSNYNDDAIAALGRSNYFLTLIGVVVLVPPAEECFFRGLIFRNLYGKSRWGAYLASTLAFTLLHILGYIGQYSAVELFIAILQYLPAGLCLAWSYTRADTIFAPIVIHAAINFLGIQSLR